MLEPQDLGYRLANLVSILDHKLMNTFPFIWIMTFTEGVAYVNRHLLFRLALLREHPCFAELGDEDYRDAFMELGLLATNWGPYGGTSLEDREELASIMKDIWASKAWTSQLKLALEEGFPLERSAEEIEGLFRGMLRRREERIKGGNEMESLGLEHDRAC